MIYFTLDLRITYAYALFMSPILTPKQKKLLDFIESHTQKKGYAPSQHEIAKHFKFKSLGTVQNYLVRLERQGVLRKTLNARRGVETLAQPPSTSTPTDLGLLRTVPPPFELPLLGRVAAGRPIEALLTQQSIEVPPSLVRGPNHFVLQVSGNSMIEDGILDGDFVIIKKQPHAHNGQTVVAVVKNEATIKRFYQHKENIELRPANPAYQSLILNSLVDSTDFKIEGVMVGLIRKTET
jgi:repressor LexA